MQHMKGVRANKHKQLDARQLLQEPHEFKRGYTETKFKPAPKIGETTQRLQNSSQEAGAATSRPQTRSQTRSQIQMLINILLCLIKI